MKLAGDENANECPRCNLHTYIGTPHSTREGIDSESSDRETPPSQQGYDAEEF